MAQRPNTDDLDADALMEQLGAPPQKQPTLGVDPLLPHQRLPELGGIPDGGPTSNTMPISGAAPSVTPATAQPSVFQGFTPKHAMEGFEFGREQNTGKSAKDAFAFLSNQAPPPPLNDKAALGQWFDQYIAPGMNQLGHKVTGPAQGDKFGFENWQGKFDVDFGRGAGADGGALAWQVDDGTAQMPHNATYTPQQLAVRQPTADQNTSMDRILAEIDALANGGASQMDADALMQILQV